DLPAHLPGLIPMPPIVSGYLSDLRKQAGLIETRDDPAPTVSGVNARRLRSTWTTHGQARAETAVLFTHDDHVYILRANSDANHEAPALEALQAMLDSLRWIK